MYLRLSFITLVALASFPFDTHQTLREKYGKPIPDAYAQPGAETYLVRPGIAVSVRYGNSGRVCNLLVRPEPAIYPIDSRKNAISAKLVDQVLAELVPQKERGRYVIGGFRNLYSLDPDSTDFGTEEEWEKITIVRNGNIEIDQFATVHWNRHECGPETHS
jgi:hypothetical protein